MQNALSKKPKKSDIRTSANAKAEQVDKQRRKNDILFQPPQFLNAPKAEQEITEPFDRQGRWTYPVSSYPSLIATGDKQDDKINFIKELLDGTAGGASQFGLVNANVPELYDYMEKKKRHQQLLASGALAEMMVDRADPEGVKKLWSIFPWIKEGVKRRERRDMALQEGLRILLHEKRSIETEEDNMFVYSIIATGHKMILCPWYDPYGLLIFKKIEEYKPLFDEGVKRGFFNPTKWGPTSEERKDVDTLKDPTAVKKWTGTFNEKGVDVKVKIVILRNLYRELSDKPDSVLISFMQRISALGTYIGEQTPLAMFNDKTGYRHPRVAIDKTQLPNQWGKDVSYRNDHTATYELPT